MLTPSGQLPLRYFKSSSQWSWVMKGGVTSPLKLTHKKNWFFFSSESSAALSFLNETSPWQEVKSRVSLHQRTKVITVCARAGECLWQSPTLSQNASGYSLDISAYTPPVISLKKKKKRNHSDWKSPRWRGSVRSRRRSIALTDSGFAVKQDLFRKWWDVQSSLAL